METLTLDFSYDTDCPRCDGSGYFAGHAKNTKARYANGLCFACRGKGAASYNNEEWIFTFSERGLTVFFEHTNAKFDLIATNKLFIAYRDLNIEWVDRSEWNRETGDHNRRYLEIQGMFSVRLQDTTKDFLNTLIDAINDYKNPELPMH